MAALLTLRDIKLGFGGPNLLDSLNLQIDPRERLCLLGRNGEGKSTLMNIIGCLDTPTGGSYVLNNTDVSQLVDDDLAEIG